MPTKTLQEKQNNDKIKHKKGKDKNYESSNWPR